MDIHAVNNANAWLDAVGAKRKCDDLWKLGLRTTALQLQQRH